MHIDIRFFFSSNTSLNLNSTFFSITEQFSILWLILKIFKSPYQKLLMIYLAHCALLLHCYIFAGRAELPLDLSFDSCNLHRKCESIIQGRRGIYGSGSKHLHLNQSKLRKLRKEEDTQDKTRSEYIQKTLDLKFIYSEKATKI